MRNTKPVPALAIEGYAKQKYAGFLHGYNRGILANRVHDLLTEIAFARQLERDDEGSSNGLRQFRPGITPRPRPCRKMRWTDVRSI